jgi:hypothetical protein
MACIAAGGGGVDQGGLLSADNDSLEVIDGGVEGGRIERLFDAPAGGPGVPG